jgi:hypothetical protein
VRVNGSATEAVAPTAALEVLVATLQDGECRAEARETTCFNHFFEDFAEWDEPALDSADRGEASAAALGRFVERVRGGQIVLADVTGDHVPDLVQVTQRPASRGVRISVLVGRIDNSAGLRFGEPAGSAP